MVLVHIALSLFVLYSLAHAHHVLLTDTLLFPCLQTPKFILPYFMYQPYSYVHSNLDDYLKNGPSEVLGHYKNLNRETIEEKVFAGK